MTIRDDVIAAVAAIALDPEAPTNERLLAAQMVLSEPEPEPDATGDQTGN